MKREPETWMGPRWIDSGELPPVIRIKFSEEPAPGTARPVPVTSEVRLHPEIREHFRAIWRRLRTRPQREIFAEGFDAGAWLCSLLTEMLVERGLKDAKHDYQHVETKRENREEKYGILKRDWDDYRAGGMTVTEADKATAEKYNKDHRDNDEKPMNQRRVRDRLRGRTRPPKKPQ